MSTAQQVRARERLIFDNRARVEANLLRARRLGDRDPAVLVLDLDDRRGRAVAEALSSPGAVAAHRAGRRRPGLKPLVVCGLPRPAAAAHLRPHFPEFAAAVAGAGTGDGYLAVAVAAGGAVAALLGPGRAPDGRPVMRVLLP